MGKYSIKDLERLSGIKAHTIRMWEQRYKIVVPDRTETNIRLYSDNDLKKILNISLLNQKGYKISRIARMTEEELAQEVITATRQDDEQSNHINILTLAMITMDEERFEKIISTYTLRHGFEKTMIQVIYPFLQRIGVMWQAGSINPAQEHFISNLIRQKLIVAIDGQPRVSAHNSNTFILFCPEGELHEIPLLLADYLLRARKFRTIYLGIQVPQNDLRQVVDMHQPLFLFSAITSPLLYYTPQQYILELSRQFSTQKIILTGQQISNQSFRTPENVYLLRQVTDIIGLLEKLHSTSSKRYGNPSN